MNLPETSSSAFVKDSDRPPRPASVLVSLSASGVILTVGDAAGTLWQTAPASLVGLPVVTLFECEITSTEADWQEAQWEALLAIATERRVPMQAKTRESALVDVILQIHPAHGDHAAYFAEIQPAPLQSTRPPVSPASEPVATKGLTLLSENSALGFFDIDIKTGRTTYSPGWKRLLGYAEEELADTYDSWLQLIHPEDTAAAPERVGKTLTTGTRNFSVEFRMRHRLGHYVWIQSLGTQFFDSDGQLERVLGVNLDITDHKELEEKSAANEERLKRLCDKDGLALFDLDFTSNTHRFSNTFGTLLGASPSEVSAEKLLNALTPEDGAHGLVAFFSLHSPDKNFFSRRLRLRGPADANTSFLLGAHRQWSRRRELMRVVGFLIPLPPSSENDPLSAIMMPSLFASLGEAVIITDVHSRITYLNPKAEHLTGWRLAEACKLKLGDVFRLIRQEDGKSDQTAVDVVLALEETPRLYAEHSLVPASAKTPVPITWTARQAWDQDKPAGMVVVFRDPHEMSLTPEEIIRANRFESLGQLAGGIAHDFNNLLTTILGGISQAKDSHDYTRLADSESACLAAKSLTRQLLTFSKGSSDKASQQVVNVADILNDAVRIATAGSTALVAVEVKDRTAPIEVDRSQIIQVFQNLIINSVQAMPEPSSGRVTLRAACVNVKEGEVPPLPAGDYVQIEVQDNGSGIPPENLSKIFDPFFTTKKQGTGLGLATVLTIVRKHGGQIGVDSTAGAGTTFTLFFPQASRPVEAPIRRAPALRFGTGRILFMDDDPKICDLTAGMLANLDYTCDIVRNGADAITFYKRYLNIGRPYDAVIMDLNVIGGMGGEECFKALRDLHPEVRAIVSSGYDSEDMARRCYDMGFVGYLTKPYRTTDLGKVIKAALGSAEDSRKPVPPPGSG